jgi:hypothetical protein
MNISLIGNSALRLAIQRNLVSFPSQIPAVMKRPGDDMHERAAYLYFARGWPLRNICTRYCLSKAMAHRLVSEWRIRAVAAGYIQDIHPEDLDALIGIKDDTEFDPGEAPGGANAGGVSTGGPAVQMAPAASRSMASGSGL